MMTERLLRKASQAIATTAGTGVLATALLVAAPSARAQYAVSDSTLTNSVQMALKSDATLKNADIQVSASQGVVTLTGKVANEAERVEAEQAVSGVSGVRSIQDNVTLPPGASQTTPPPPPDVTATDGDGASQGNGMPPPPPANAGDQANTAPSSTANPGEQDNNMPPPPPPPDETPAAPSAGSPTAQNGYPPRQAPGAYPGQTPGQYPGGYPNPAAENGGWGPRGNAHPPASASQLGVSPQVQNASGPVTIPSGTLVSVRTEQPLSTTKLKGGEYFEVTSAADVYENGVVAIPRGAVLTGKVLEAKNAGALGGRPILDLQLTSIQLGGMTYPLQSEVWSTTGANKAGYTATNTAGGAIFGALIGAIAGGGAGAGIGALAGGASGALISGATHGPRLDLPPEALLQFRLAAPLRVQPVRFDEAQRLAASAPQPTLQRRPMYPPPQPYPYGPRPYPYGYPYPY